MKCRKGPQFLLPDWKWHFLWKYCHCHFFYFCYLSLLRENSPEIWHWNIKQGSISPYIFHIVCYFHIQVIEIFFAVNITWINALDSALPVHIQFECDLEANWCLLNSDDVKKKISWSLQQYRIIVVNMKVRFFWRVNEMTH